MFCTLGVMREIGMWWQGDARPGTERRFIYLREIKMFRILITPEGKPRWEKDFPSEQAAREAADEIMKRVGGEWSYDDAPPSK